MSHVSMPISKSLMLPVTVAMCGLRSVLRPFIRRPDTSFVAILALREWDALPYYKTAARELLSIKSSRMAEWENSQVVTTIEDFEHMRFKLEVFDLVRAATQVVVFVPNLDDVPLKIRTLADFSG
jgi:cell division protease FtsH